MRYLEPKGLNAKKVNWEISEQTREIVKQYAEYAERTENETVDLFLTNILTDKKFLEWIGTKRNNKRIVQKMGLEGKIKINSN